MYSFSTDSHVFQSDLKDVVAKEVVGMTHHPRGNYLAIWDEKVLGLWKP